MKKYAGAGGLLLPRVWGEQPQFISQWANILKEIEGFVKISQKNRKTALYLHPSNPETQNSLAAEFLDILQKSKQKSLLRT